MSKEHGFRQSDELRNTKAYQSIDTHSVRDVIFSNSSKSSLINYSL